MVSAVLVVASLDGPIRHDEGTRGADVRGSRRFFMGWFGEGVGFANRISRTNRVHRQESFTWKEKRNE
jgi:hypothetical protein